MQTIIDKILEFREIKKKYEPYLKHERDIAEILDALGKVQKGKVVGNIIEINSPVNFGYYRKEKSLNELCKMYNKRLGIRIDHHGDAFGDDYDVSFLTFDMLEDSPAKAIMKAKEIMPKLKVKWVEEKEL